MKVKDVERTANIAWSPANVTPIYLAAGTAGQQLDASFSTNAALEIFALNLDEPGAEVEARAHAVSEHRFHTLAWSNYGSEAGTLVGGCDGGALQIYNASKLLAGETALVAKQDKHSGAVHSIDFNPFQNYLLASGAASSEIFIWDLNNLSSPMTPGAKSQPPEDVLGIQWNRQVQHILASTFASKCVVWDLRKNETIIKLTDTVSRIRWKVVAWHPEVATQLCLASEDDQAPVIQLWDLRFATSPLKTLENHQRGVLSMAWCAQDPDLLISGGKDNRLLCWNPNSNQQGGEILSEVASTSQWCFDIAWCPKNPALIATPSFDGHVSVYSLLGGKAQQIQTTNKIADSFPGMDAGDYVEAPIQQAPTVNLSVDLTKAPKWLKKPVGASFGFGGKLITFDHDKASIPQAPAVNGHAPQIQRPVYISQVITEAVLVQKSMDLEQALELGNFTDYCRNKADSSNDQHTRYVWHFLKANFEQNPRTEYLNLLGYKIEDVNAKLAPHLPPKQEDAFNQLNQQFMTANRIDSSDGFDQIQAQQQQPAPKTVTPYRINTGDDSDGLIAQALLMNNVEAAADLCIKAKRFADAIIIALTGGPELCARTQAKYLEQCEGYVSSLISALVREDWASVMTNCDIDSWREALAAIFTHSSDDDLPVLCEMMGTRLEQESITRSSPQLLQDAQLCYICAGSFEKLVTSWTTSATMGNDDLQDLVELVTFLQKSVERQGKRVQVDGRLAELLSNYAMILASQGNLSTALTYLGSSKDPAVADLRERLYIALGHKPAAYAPTQVRSRQNTHRSSITSTYSQTWLPQPVTSQPAWQAQPQAAPAPWQPAPAQQPWQQQQQQAPPPLSNPFAQSPPSPGPPNLPPTSTQSPRPLSVGPPGLPKSKYVVDPSVQSAYGSPMRNNSFNNGSMMPPGQYQPFVPTPIAAQANMMTPQPTPFAVPFVPQPVPQSEMPNAPITSAMNALPPTAAPGWNDPPVLNKAPKQSLPRTDVPQAPITHPIFGTAPVTPMQPGPPNGYMDPMNPHQHAAPPPTQQQQPYNPYMNQPMMQQQPIGQPPMEPAMFPSSTAPPQFGNFNTQPIMQTQQAPAGHQQAPPAEPAIEAVAEPAPKPPIPEEHIHMQTVFDELRMQCGRAANNPQTKRKIEDVGRKLDTLYDLLREHKLSANALAGLHQMVQQVQHGDYTGGLQMHTQLVSGQDFAQIAAFMPGLKVLLQCALQLQVYLR